jgi:hypothetical protein
MSQDRRGFLETVIAAGLVPVVGGRAERRKGGKLTPDEPSTVPPFRRSASPNWDMSWTTRLSGRYRAVFDSPKADNGGELWRAASWKGQVSDVYGAKPEEVNAVVVIRHGAIALVMDDEFWRRHEIGKKRKIKDPMTGKRAEGNPILSFEGRQDIPAEMAGGSLTEFLKRGGTVLACNFAFGAMVHYEAEVDKEHAKDARERALAHLVPGVILQPSGFFALLEAQRAGCHLFTAGE